MLVVLVSYGVHLILYDPELFGGHSVPLFFKMACNSETAGCRVNGTKIWESATLVTYVCGAFYFMRFKVILGVIRCTCLKIVCISKTSGHRAKRGKIWVTWILLSNIWYISPCRAQSFGVIQCTCLKTPCISKTAGRRVKRSEI